MFAVMYHILAETLTSRLGRVSSVRAVMSFLWKLSLVGSLTVKQKCVKNKCSCKHLFSPRKQTGTAVHLTNIRYLQFITNIRNNNSRLRFKFSLKCVVPRT